MRILFALAVSLFLGVLVCFAICGVSADIEAERFATNPLISQGVMLPSCDNSWDVNFPSVIRTPQWLEPRLGEYYMYFSDHHGLYIYLAFADQPTGPWRAYAPATLSLEQVYTANNSTFNLLNYSSHAECASPDVYVDSASRQIRMYFHARVPNTNYAILGGVAFSSDGLRFAPQPGFIGRSYLRHFTWYGDDYIYLVDRQGVLQRSLDGYTNLQTGNNAIGSAFTDTSMLNGDGYTGLVRHIGVSVVGHTLYIFGTRIGDAPERILWTSMDLRCTLTNWTACLPDSPAQEGFRPEYDYEGANLPVLPSKKGDSGGPVNQLRDPFPFAADGECLMFYTAAGENAVAGARIPSHFCFDPEHHEPRYESRSKEAAGPSSAASRLSAWLRVISA